MIKLKQTVSSMVQGMASSFKGIHCCLLFFCLVPGLKEHWEKKSKDGYVFRKQIFMQAKQQIILFTCSMEAYLI